MAIKKKLIHFNKRSEFDKKTKATSLSDIDADILYNSIVFIKDTKEIWTHGQFYSDLKLGEYSSTAFDGERGKRLYDAVFNSDYEAIDLGLPSGTLWADRNIGAANVYEGGSIFQWGDPIPFDIPEHDENGNITGDKRFAFADYKWSTGDDGMSKYNSTDNKVTLDAEDDAATAIMGENWATPTIDQIRELFEYTTCEVYINTNNKFEKVGSGTFIQQGVTYAVEWDNYDIPNYFTNGQVAYIKLLSKNNGNSLILPSNVVLGLGQINTQGHALSLWSKTLDSTAINKAFMYEVNNFSHSVASIAVNKLRYFGKAVRGVTKNPVDYLRFYTKQEIDDKIIRIEANKEILSTDGIQSIPYLGIWNKLNGKQLDKFKVILSIQDINIVYNYELSWVRQSDNAILICFEDIERNDAYDISIVKDYPDTVIISYRNSNLLRTATKTRKGLVKIGDTIDIDNNGTIEVSDDVISSISQKLPFCEIIIDLNQLEGNYGGGSIDLSDYKDNYASFYNKIAEIVDNKGTVVFRLTDQNETRLITELQVEPEDVIMLADSIAHNTKYVGIINERHPNQLIVTRQKLYYTGVATTSSNGLLSYADKTKLDNIYYLNVDKSIADLTGSGVDIQLTKSEYDKLFNAARNGIVVLSLLNSSASNNRRDSYILTKSTSIADSDVTGNTNRASLSYIGDSIAISVRTTSQDYKLQLYAQQNVGEVINPANKTTRGTVLIGDNINVDTATSSDGSVIAGRISVPTATNTVKGVVKGGDGVNISSDGTLSVPEATTTTSGLLSSSDKVKLNNLPSTIESDVYILTISLLNPTLTLTEFNGLKNAITNNKVILVYDVINETYRNVKTSGSFDNMIGLVLDDIENIGITFSAILSTKNQIDCSVEYLSYTNFIPIGNTTKFGLISISNEINSPLYLSQTDNRLCSKRIENVTYAQLVAKRNAGQLIAGTLYKITDYTFADYVKKDTSLIAYQPAKFDIIVQAISNLEVAEKAWACSHEGNTYYSNCNISAWQVWYTLDNSRYSWGDIDNGKGVIYRLIDEHGNDCDFDFKSPLITVPNIEHPIKVFNGMNEAASDITISDTTKVKNNKIRINGDFKNLVLIEADPTKEFIGNTIINSNCIIKGNISNTTIKNSSCTITSGTLSQAIITNSNCQLDGDMYNIVITNSDAFALSNYGQLKNSTFNNVRGVTMVNDESSKASCNITNVYENGIIISGNPTELTDIRFTANNIARKNITITAGVDCFVNAYISPDTCELVTNSILLSTLQ